MNGWSISSRLVSASSPVHDPARSSAIATCGSSASSGSSTCRAGSTSPMAAAGQCSSAISVSSSPRDSGPIAASTCGIGRLRHHASGRSGCP
ncbi:hypothetical protein AB0K48_21960 [Nonomuraea sp. NPDC055795]